MDLVIRSCHRYRCIYCGSIIGGIKLAPNISPNKTWAGLLGEYLVA